MSTRVAEFAIAAAIVGTVAALLWWLFSGNPDERFDPDAAPPVYSAFTTCSSGNKYEHYEGTDTPDPLVWKKGDCTVAYKTNQEYLGWVEKQKWLTEEEKERAADEAAEEQ